MDDTSTESAARRRMLAIVIVALSCLLMGSLHAQTVRVANHSTAPLGPAWIRTTVDTLPPHAAGETDGAAYRVGRAIGLDTHVVDVRCALAPGEQRTLDLATFAEVDVVPPALPANLLAHFGGGATIAGQPAEIVALAADGAAVTVQLRARVGRMLCTNVWLTWYPDNPGWCTGEALTVASNPAVPDMGATVPPGFDLRFGDALVIVPGAGLAPLVSAGTYLADGQGKAVPITLIWFRHLTRASDWSSVGAVADLGLGAVGVRSLLSTGAPLVPEGFSGRAWAASRLVPAVARLHTWDPPVVGPPGISGSAGQQEDSLLHAGAEALTADGVGAEKVRWLAALKYAERPNGHLEADGSPLDIDRHPSLMFWDGRPRPQPPFLDNLGKPRLLDVAETNGRWGPDTQHTYVRTLVASARIKGSPACQYLMRNLASVYLLQRTVDPARLGTTATWAAREWGCEGQFVQDMHRDLEDRAMAARVVARWRERVERVMVPQMQGRDLLMIFKDDPRVNPTGDGAQWWQESFASWSIDETCRVVGPEAGRAVAQRIARRVLDTAWRWVDGTAARAAAVAPHFADEELQAIHEASAGGEDAAEVPHWRAQPQGPIDGSANEQNPASDSFNHYGMPLCVAVVLRQEPSNTKARAIWTQLLAATAEDSRRWMPPIVLEPEQPPPPTTTPANLGNRSSGMAPLSVIFDATAAGIPQPPDYGAWHCEWDYGDGASGTWSTTGRSRNGGIGWLGAHVYEQPGAYTATLTTVDADGSEAKFSQVITVALFDGPTIYVAAAGADTNPGTEAQPLRSWDRGLATLFASPGPRRLLLRRGDEFVTADHALLPPRTGPFWIGAYGTGERPRVTATSDYGLCFARDVQDLRVADLDLRLAATAPVAWAEGWTCGPSTTFLRCRLTGFGTGLVVERGDCVFADCEVLQSTGYGITGFIPSDAIGQRFAVLGCRLDGARQHLLRYTMSRVLVGENVFGTVTGIGHAIKQHGRELPEPQRFSCVVGNRFETACGWVHAIGPQDDFRAEHSLDTLVEGNLYRPVGGVGTVLSVFAERVTVRNNIVDVADGAECLSVRRRGNGPVPSHVVVENNTWLRRAGAPLQTMLNCQSADATAVRGNVMWCAGGVAMPAGTVSLAGNVTADPRLAADYTPGAGSPAIDAAGTKARVDATRARRGGAVDAGAVEVR